MPVGKGLGRFRRGAVEVSRIQVQEAAIDVDAGNAAMVLVGAVDRHRLVEVGACLGADLFDAQALFADPVGGRGGIVAGGAVGGGGPVELLLAIQGQQALDEREVGERARKLQVAPAAQAVFVDGPLEIFDSALEFSPALGDAPVGRLDIAAAQEVVGVAQRIVGAAKQGDGLLQLFPSGMPASFAWLA